MIVAVPKAFPEYYVGETPCDAEQVSHNSLNHATDLPSLLGQDTVVQVDDGGDEDPPEEGDNISLGEVALTQSLLQPDMTVVPDPSPTRHNTRS